MNYEIREMRPSEYPLLEDFLMQAIFVPEGYNGVLTKDIIAKDPKLAAAIDGFGSLPDDHAFVAVAEGVVVGACWVRTTNEYGHIDYKTPSFSISILDDFQNQGIGTLLMQRMLDLLMEEGYMRASLSVQKDNYAVRMYERLGFSIIGDGFDDSEWLMIKQLGPTLQDV